MKFTKPEIIGVLFSKLKPDKEDVFVDIGCGSGAVSEFFASYVKKVYAVDIDNEAIKNTSKRVEKFGNVIVKCMDGVEFLEKYNDYTIVFFGGTKNIEKMLKIASRKAKKIAVNAARIDMAIYVANIMKELGIFKEIILVNVAKSYELAGGLAFKPLNPVFIIFGQKTDGFI